MNVSRSRAEANPRRGLLVVSLVMIAAFGPYVAAGLRTEQFVVYPLATCVLVLALPLLRPTPAFAVVLIGWSTYLAVNLLGVVSIPIDLSKYPPGISVLAGIDNATLPLAVMAIVLGLIRFGADPRSLLARASTLLVLLMCLNTLAALIQYKAGYSWTAWYGSSATESVSFHAGQLGRFSGLINQPAEAGILYSAAGLCALYALNQKGRLLTLALAMIVLGGVLTVSKVFLLIGLPLIVVALLRHPEGRASRLFAAAMVGLGAWVAIASGLFASWSGGGFLQRNLVPNANSGLVQTLTASRYGGSSGGTLSEVVHAVMSGPRMGGYGARGLLVPYDSGWVEALITAGIVGVIAQAVVLLALWRGWVGTAPSPERTLFGLLVILVALASLGVPSMTANRVATVVWVLLSCCLMIGNSKTAPEVAPAAAKSRPKTHAALL